MGCYRSRRFLDVGGNLRDSLYVVEFGLVAQSIMVDVKQIQAANEYFA
jgi:hypothetical protein